MYQIAFDPTSNASDWTDVFQVLGDDNAVSNIYDDGWTVTVSLFQLPHGTRNAWDYGGSAIASPILTASTANGTVTVNANDALEWTFTAAQMGRLNAGAYGVGILATKNDQTVQLALGALPVIQGY